MSKDLEIFREKIGLPPIAGSQATKGINSIEMKGTIVLIVMNEATFL
jgi:hypothetical protein